MTATLPPPRLHRTGDGAPVVLLHPLGVDHTVWEPLRDGLEGTVVTYDLPGHGASPPPPAGCTVEDMADSLATALRAAGLGPACVVGVSLGGLVAQVLAADHADLVDRVVVVDAVAVYPEPMRQMWRDRARLVRSEGMAPVVGPTLELWFTAAALAADGATVHGVRSLLASADPEGYARAAEALAVADTTGRAARIGAPTLVVCGDDDAPPFRDAARWLEQTVPAARLHWLAGARHAGAFERAEEFLAAVAGFRSARAEEPVQP